jgi:hypothetical protein
VDSTAVVGSAVHISIRPVNNVSKGVISGKKPGRPSRKSITRIQSNGASAVGINWWRGGRLSRELFHWKMLPQSLACKAARQGLQYLFQMVWLLVPISYRKSLCDVSVRLVLDLLLVG